MRVGLLAAIGSGLLIASQLADRLDRIEGDPGLEALNLIFALPIALLIVATIALIGDSLLRASERRPRRRPEGRALGVVMIAAGAAAAGAIVAAHLSRPLAVDDWLGIAGGLLLILAGTAHHQLTHRVTKGGRGR